MAAGRCTSQRRLHINTPQLLLTLRISKHLRRSIFLLSHCTLIIDVTILRFWASLFGISSRLKVKHGKENILRHQTQIYSLQDKCVSMDLISLSPDNMQVYTLFKRKTAGVCVVLLTVPPSCILSNGNINMVTERRLHLEDKQTVIHTHTLTHRFVQLSLLGHWFPFITYSLTPTPTLHWPQITPSLSTQPTLGQFYMLGDRKFVFNTQEPDQKVRFDHRHPLIASIQVHLLPSVSSFSPSSASFSSPALLTRLCCLTFQTLSSSEWRTTDFRAEQVLSGF